MKKTLIAVAALSAMAASAMAANVTLYGKIDQGFQVQSKKVKNEDGQQSPEPAYMDISPVDLPNLADSFS